MNALTGTLLVTLTEAPPSGEAVLPSVFELYLVDQLDALLKPAFRHVWSSLVNLLPARMSALSDALFDRWQELYTIVLVAAQYHSIKEHHRTIAEGIYGLRRVNFTQEQSAAPPIDATQQDISIALVAFMPSILDALGRVSASIRRRRQQRLARWNEHHGTALVQARTATTSPAAAAAETELASGRVLVTPVRTLRPPPPAPPLPSMSSTNSPRGPRSLNSASASARLPRQNSS
jgi:DNA-binding transcriptional regulator YbjK